MEALQGWGEYLALALPNTAACVLEWGAPPLLSCRDCDWPVLLCSSKRILMWWPGAAPVTALCKGPIPSCVSCRSLSAGPSDWQQAIELNAARAAGLYEGLILVAGLLPDAESVVAVMGITFNTCAPL